MGKDGNTKVGHGTRSSRLWGAADYPGEGVWGHSDMGTAEECLIGKDDFWGFHGLGCCTCKQVRDLSTEWFRRGEVDLDGVSGSGYSTNWNSLEPGQDVVYACIRL